MTALIHGIPGCHAGLDPASSVFGMHGKDTGLRVKPAMTAGAISLEREKQTLELLVTTPLGTLALVLGKLFSALTYVFLLILASIPLASIVFTFGGVGPEDLVRGYVFLFALAVR